jgi:hypothetical protein
LRRLFGALFANNRPPAASGGCFVAQKQHPVYRRVDKIGENPYHSLIASSGSLSLFYIMSALIAILSRWVSNFSNASADARERWLAGSADIAELEHRMRSIERGENLI